MRSIELMVSNLQIISSVFVFDVIVSGRGCIRERLYPIEAVSERGCIRERLYQIEVVSERGCIR